MIVVLHFKVTHNVLRIGDGADFTRKLYYYKLIFGTSKIVKLTSPSHYCQYDVICCVSSIYFQNSALNLVLRKCSDL